MAIENGVSLVRLVDASGNDLWIAAGLIGMVEVSESGVTRVWTPAGSRDVSGTPSQVMSRVIACGHGEVISRSSDCALGDQ